MQNKLRDIIGNDFDIDVDKFTRESTLAEIGLDSLDQVEAMFQIEEELDINIDDEALKGFKNIGSIIDYLEGKT